MVPSSYHPMKMDGFLFKNKMPTYWVLNVCGAYFRKDAFPSIL